MNTLFAANVLVYGAIIFGLIVFRNPSRIVFLLLLWIPLQSIVLTIMWQYLGLSVIQVRFMIGLKDLAAWSLFLFLLLTGRIRKLRSLDMLVFSYFGFVTIFLALPKAIMPAQLNVMAQLASYRMLVSPVILYMIGRFTPIPSISVTRLIHIVILLSVSMSIFGLVERFLLPAKFWETTINMGGYKSVVQGMGEVKYTDSVSEFLSMFRTVAGSRQRRLVSYVGHPAAVSYYLSFTIIFIVAFLLIGTKQKVQLKRNLLIPILMLLIFVQIMTLGRGGVLASFIGIVSLFFVHKRMLPGFMLTILLVPYFLWNLLKGMVQVSLPSYFGGIELGLRFGRSLKTFLINPLGLGLGHDPMWGYRFATSEHNIVPLGESGYFNIGIQTGVIGLLIFFFILIRIVIYFKSNVFCFKNDIYHNALTQTIACSTLGYMVAFAFSSFLLSFTSMGTYWIFVGLGLQFIEKEFRQKWLKTSHENRVGSL